jgi:hypothetical protein
MMMKILVCQSISENNRNSFLSFVFEVFPLEKALRIICHKPAFLHKNIAMSFCKSNVPPNTPIIILVSKTLYEPGADPGFQVRGRGAHLKKMRREKLV